MNSLSCIKTPAHILYNCLAFFVLNKNISFFFMRHQVLYRTAQFFFVLKRDISFLCTIHLWLLRMIVPHVALSWHKYTETFSILKAPPVHTSFQLNGLLFLSKCKSPFQLLKKCQVQRTQFLQSNRRVGLPWCTQALFFNWVTNGQC
jgi:hypothetical protein